MTGRVAVPGAPAPGRARLRASAWDYLVIVAWIAVLSVLGAGLRAVLPGRAEPSVAATDGLAFACSVLPVWLYLTLTEGGERQATWGKRRAGLRVVGRGDRRAGWARIALRSTVKLLPWQLAHVAVVRLALDVDEPALIAVAYGTAVLLPLVSIGIAWRDPRHRALHDLAAGTRVVSA